MELSPKIRSYYSLQSELQNRTSVDNGDKDEPMAILVKLFIVEVKGLDIKMSLPPPGPVKTPNDLPAPLDIGFVIRCKSVRLSRVPVGAGEVALSHVLKELNGQFMQIWND